MFEPSEKQLAMSIESMINDQATELMNNRMLDIFTEMDDGEEYLKKLYSAGILGLVDLQQRFRMRIAHEALEMARRNVRPSDVSRMSMRIQDENECSALETWRAV